MTRRECEVCGKPVVRRQGETPYHFDRRRTCSVSCGTLLRSRLAGAATQLRYAVNPVDPYGPQRYCAVCSGPIPKVGRRGNYRRRKTCSAACASRLSGKHGALRRCLACDQVLRRRDDEYPSTFRRRTTCGAECAELVRHASPSEIEMHRELARLRRPVEWQNIFVGQNIKPDTLDGAPLRGIRPADRRTYGGVSG